MIDSVSTSASLRVLRFLSRAGLVSAVDFGNPIDQRIILSTTGDMKMLCQRDVLDSLHKASLIELSDGKCRLLSLGKRRLARLNATKLGDDSGGFADQHRDLIKQEMKVNGLIQTVSVNRNESPLARLRSRKRPNGQPWISSDEFDAGERLRSDFSRSQMMRNVTMNWDPNSSGSKGRGQSGAGEIPDFAVDAKLRIETALKFVGPDLAGLLTDVCCFLKGLESIERERRWPPRSAKLMLRTGLGLLVRHYDSYVGKTQNHIV